VLAAVRLEHVELREGALVEEHLQALAGRVLALLVLLADALLAAAEAGLRPQVHQFAEFAVLHGAHAPYAVASAGKPRRDRMGGTLRQTGGDGKPRILPPELTAQTEWRPWARLPALERPV
jgi:hypothetical protein